MSGLSEEEELRPNTLPGWQTGDSQYIEGHLLQMSVTMCSVPPSTRRTSLEMSRRQPVLSSSVEKLFMMTKKKDVGPCSQSTDRKVSKIILHTEPMVQEEQYNCTSSGALNTVALQQRKTKSSVF